MAKLGAATGPGAQRWKGWPTGIRQRAVDIVATTRRDWSACATAAAPAVRRTQFRRSLFAIGALP